MKLLFDANLSPTLVADPAESLVSETVEVFAQRLRSTPGKNVWMMGGGGLIASFLDAGEIDEFDMHVIPVMIGEGIPLVAPRHRDIPLRLRSSQEFPDGVVRLRYEAMTKSRTRPPSAAGVAM